MLDLVAIRQRLAAAPQPSAPRSVNYREAAVAVVLRARGDATDMLFIQRATRRGDPWSGQMAFPGGHRDSGDANLVAAAVRETAEEIGLDISTAEPLAALPRQRPASGGRNLAVAPFVFAINGDPPLRLNHEVAAALWTSVEPMHRGANAARSRPPFHQDSAAGDPAAFQGFRVNGGRFVWGLTFRIVQTFFEAVDATYRPLLD